MNLNIIDCFCTSFPDSGNRAAVITDFDGDKNDKQSLAKQLNLPVTVFISDKEAQIPTLEYFYPDTEMPLCLHGTIAASEILLQERETESCVFITSNGYKLNINKRESLIQVEVAKQQSPAIEIDRTLICRMLNLSDEAVIDDLAWPLTVASVGSPKLLIPIKSKEALLQLEPDASFIKEWSIANQVNGLYLYATPNASESDIDFFARGFNPKTGHHEDAATGVATAALATCLKKSLIIQQGDKLGCPCTIVTTYVDDEHIFVGGKTSVVPSEEYLSLLEHKTTLRAAF